MTSRKTKALVSVFAVLVIAIAGAIVLRALWDTAKSSLSADVCTVGGYDLDPDQAAVASTMVGAVTKYPRQLPERASVLVLAAGLQESKLTNLPPGAGDRDSVGVLQQRPSTGWGGGSAARLTDVGEATKEFLDYLVQHVPGWQRLPVAVAVQRVQISADPSGESYGQHEAEAQALADALQGVTPAAISCSFAAPTKVASTAKVAEQAGSQLGIDTPRAATAHTVRVPGAHWQTVAWFVANADRLGIERVGFAGRVWTRAHGWQAGRASAAAVTATMYYLSGPRPSGAGS
jgi:hypothetical protein